ncbi:cuedc2 [Trichonephila clavipes]|nr:cuedc2 [Trichonephila clavipes]
MSNSSSTDVDQDALVKSELSKFIMEHTGLDALSSIDEIVLSYIIGVLETLGCANSPEDVFDVDEFAEMMTAYIPDFSNIRRCLADSTYLNFRRRLQCFGQSFSVLEKSQQQNISWGLVRPTRNDKGMLDNDSISLASGELRCSFLTITFNRLISS